MRQLLDLPTRQGVDTFLKQAGAHLHYTEEDLDDDVGTLDDLLAE